MEILRRPRPIFYTGNCHAVKNTDLVKISDYSHSGILGYCGPSSENWRIVMIYVFVLLIINPFFDVY